MAHLLIVDDEQSICWAISRLAEELGHTVTAAASAEQGLAAAKQQRPDLILLDVRLPGIDGLSAMPGLREAAPDVPIVVMTAYGELSTAVTAVRNGAFDYLAKPFDLAVAQRTIERAFEQVAARKAERAATGNSAKPQAVDAGGEPPIIGKSPPMQEVFKRIALVAPSDACVYLHGESGAGKELVARAIHLYSRRSDGPFIAVNMAALSESLAESELFGHVRGAFTGAEQNRKGLLEQASGGTIFLDEVAEIPLTLQVKLLRVLEHGDIVPVGGNQSVKSDFRLISATNQSLSDLVASGSFRHDLYFRLVTFEIQLPPLRQRVDDIPLLVEYFLDRLAARQASPSGPRTSISEAALAELRRRPWHGNVRELRNAIEHGSIMARGGVIAVEHLPAPMLPAGGSGSNGTTNPEQALAALIQEWTDAQLTAGDEDLVDLHERFLRMVEPALLTAVMQRSGGQYVSAARKLGLHRTTLRKRLEELGLAGDGE